LAFWLKVSDSGLLAKPNLILAGDFNFTLSSAETWGSSPSIDAMTLQYSAIFQQNNLIDLLPAEMVPTWRNGRSGTTSISKRLDQFFISDSLLQQADRYRTWVAYPFISDHAPIILQLDSYSHRSPYPFKFNPIWLGNPDFERLVKEVWTDKSFIDEPDVQRRLAGKLKLLKTKVKVGPDNSYQRHLIDCLRLNNKYMILLLKSLRFRVMTHKSTTTLKTS
jgi:hypothetical protein